MLSFPLAQNPSSRPEAQPEWRDPCISLLLLLVLSKLTPTSTTATAPKKLDKRRLSTSSSNRCDLKSGYQGKPIYYQSFISYLRFRNPVDPARTPRIARTKSSDRPLFIPLTHSPFLTSPRRPPTNRSNELQSLTNQRLTTVRFLTARPTLRGKLDTNRNQGCSACISVVEIGTRCFQRVQPSVMPAAESRMAAAPTICSICRRCPKAYRSTKIATIG